MLASTAKAAVQAAAEEMGLVLSHKLEVRATFQLTECINEMVSESQLPHKIVNLVF